jgi:thimet oligopeptidase
MTSTSSTAYELVFDFATPEAVAAHAAETIAMLVQANDDVASVPLDQVTFANTAQKMIEAESSVTERASNLVVLLNTSPRDDIRMACGKALGQFMAVNTQQSMRVDSYLVTKQLASDATAMAGCTPEHTRYVERSVLIAERNGLQLDDATRAQVTAVQDEIFTREIQFGQSIADWSVELRFRTEQLEGLTDDFLADLPKDENDLYKVGQWKSKQRASRFEGQC